MAGSNLGTVWVELSLDDKIYKQKLGETLTSSTATAKGIETAWRALGTKSDATFDQMRKSAENAYTLIATASGKASQETIRAQQAAADKIKSINEQQYGQQATWIEKTKANWLGLTLAVGAAMVAMNKAAEFVELGAKAQQAEDSFKRVAESSGESADKIITSMKRATVGTVDDSDLMQRAVKGMMLGLSGDAMVKIAEMARLGARVAGTSVADAIEGITNSIATGMPRALKQYGLALGPEVKIITAAQTAGVEGINLMTLAQMNFDIQLARHGEIQANAIEQTQIFKAQITELKEQLGGALIALLRQDYGLLQALGSGFLYAAGATNYLVAGLANVAAWTADKLGFDEKAKSMKAYADFATATAKQLIADADAMKNRGVANITGNAESSKTGTTSDAQAKIAQLEKDKAAFLKDVKDRTAAMKNAGKNEAKDAQNNLAGQLSDIKSHYDAAIALDTQWYERQKENGANSVDLDNQYYDKKNADLYSSYDQQWKLIEQSSVRESEKYKNLTALNKTYEDALGKNRIELTKSLIADEKTHIDVMAAAYKTIGDYSDTCLLYTSPSPRDRTRSRMPSSA